VRRRHEGRDRCQHGASAKRTWEGRTDAAMLERPPLTINPGQVVTADSLAVRDSAHSAAKVGAPPLIRKDAGQVPAQTNVAVDPGSKVVENWVAPSSTLKD